MAIIFADLFWEDKPYNVCPRQALKRAIKNSEKRGVMSAMQVSSLNLLPCIMMRMENRLRQLMMIRSMGSGQDARLLAMMSSTHLIRCPFLKDMIDILEELGWNLHDVVAEGAYSQFELDFHYTDLLQMADRFVFLRIMLKEVAKKHGMFITFMPKPTTGDWRSGAHINFSLQSVEKTEVLIYSVILKKVGAKSHNLAVGGLMAHAEAITAITCSTVNSYNGLVPRVGGFEGGTVTWAPTNITLWL